MFGTKISTLKQLSDGNLSNMNDYFKFGIDGAGETFGNSIDYKGLDDANMAFVDLLFSEKNIDADMTVGFKGNPNIGSVVLNTFSKTNEYKEFCSSFNDGDAVFIISSIFGGTGASGFPLLLKNLRVNNPNITNSNFISQAVIGAISYLPYFRIDDNDAGISEIDSGTFYGKAKSALSYYDYAIFKKQQLNSFYYLGDSSEKKLPYADGSHSQKNNAHFLELAGALSIVDFTHDHDRLKNLQTTTIKEFGITEKSSSINFDHLGVKSRGWIAKPLSKLCLLERFLSKSKDKLFATTGRFINQEDGVPKVFYNSDFYTNDITKFLNYFKEWENEMEENDDSFDPFHDNQTHKSLLDIFNGKNKGERTGRLGIGNRSTADILIRSADRIVHNGDYKSENIESRFLKIYDAITEEHINEILS